MLRSAKEILGYRILAIDGLIGKVHDLLFEDEEFLIRYLAADTGNWLPGRKVLLSMNALEQPRWETREVPVHLTRQEVEDSPSLESDQPVSRQWEVKLFTYYGWTPYWTAGALQTPAVAVPVRGGHSGERIHEEEPVGDPHLRSVKEVSGYIVQALDGKIGHIEDFIMEDATWVIRYLVIDTRNWLPGRKVLVAPEWIDDIIWDNAQVVVGLPRESIQNSPEYDPASPVNRRYEERLYDFYGRPKYW